MFDIKNLRATMTPRSEFSYWYARAGATTATWNVFTNTPEPEFVNTYSEVGGHLEGAVDEVYLDFDTFRLGRPEYRVGQTYMNSDVIETYNTLLAGAMLIQANSDDALTRIERAFEVLASTDFYTAPASTQYHDSCIHGLIQHTLSVYNHIIDLRKVGPFSKTALAEATIVALAHDWCKINLYEGYTRNVKNEDTNSWEKVQAWKHRERPSNYFGHGDGALEIARSLMPLTKEQKLAIRWHMGRWNTVDAEVNSLQAANADFPLVHLLQFADQLSIVNY